MLLRIKIRSILWGVVVALAIVGAFALVMTLIEGQFAIETDDFDCEFEYGESIVPEGITIIDNRTLGLRRIEVTEDMIVRMDDLTTAGEKEMVISFEGVEHTVKFTVKYKVEFVSGKEVLSTQLVESISEVVIPDAPTPPVGYEFTRWDIDTQKELTSSVKINAVYKEVPYPSLSGITATYGDTLGSITLGSNSYGYWEFLDPAKTPVGNAGKQEFPVRFVYTDHPGSYKYDYVQIDVAKVEYVFGEFTEKFYYDGEPHFPAIYTDLEYITSGSASVLPGVYSYSYEIIDRNYSGIYIGTYEIVKPTVTVTVSSATIAYPEAVPEFTYTVEGFDNVELLGISINAPAFATKVGEYEVGITYTNQNVNYVVHKGTLTVVKGDTEVATPEIGTVTYEQRLGDIEFLGKYLGTWAWESPDTVVDSMDGITAYAIFTHYDENYNTVRVAIEIKNVQKKQLTIEILSNTFTYTPGGEYMLDYRVSGSIYSDVYDTLTVGGNVPETTAGTFKKVLYIDDPRYTGTVSVNLVVEQATPVTDFTTVLDKVWLEGLILGDVALPDGYSWAAPDYAIPSAGEYTFSAVFTPVDTLNYKSVEGEFTVSIHKADVNVTGVLDSYEKTYDGAIFDIKNSGIATEYTDGTITIKYLKDGTEVEQILNAGEYTLVVTVTEGTSYLGATIERTVKVLPKANTETVATSQTVNYLDPITALTLPSGIEGAWSWRESEIGSAGTKTLLAVYTPDERGNYLPREVEVTVTVKKLVIDVPTVADKQYTGSEIDTGLSDTELYTVDGDITATDAGSYSVTFTLSDPVNYEWRGDAVHPTVTRTYKISRALNSWVTAPENIKTVYMGNPVYISAQAAHGTLSIVYTLDGVEVDAPVDVGVYKVTLLATDPNYDDFTAERTIEITKATVPTPTAPVTLVYNTREQGITPVGEGLGTLYYVYSETKGTNAGDELTMVLKLSDYKNYQWSGAVDGDTFTLTAEIVKTVVSFKNSTTVDKAAWIFGDTEGVVNAASVDDTSAALGITAKLLYSYNGGAFVTYDRLAKTDGKLNAGTYAVKTVVDATVNYDGIETAAISFSVGKATPDGFTVEWSEAVSDGGLYYKNLLGAPTVTVTCGDKVLLAASVNYGISDSGFLGADTVYTFTFTPLDSVNYNSATFTSTVPLMTVATIGHGGTPYGTVEDALEAAVSGQSVFVIPNVTGNVKIMRDVSVKAGVTLVLPYGTGANDYSSNNSTEVINNQTKAGDYDNLCTNKLYIGEGVTLTVNGNLIVSGIISAGNIYYNYVGQTCAEHSRIILEHGAKITAAGTAEGAAMIRAFGFIKNADGAEGTLVMESNSTIYQPFVLRDHRNGGYLSSIYAVKDDYDFSPFTRFIVNNVECFTVYEYGSELIGAVNINTSLGVQQASGKLIGSTLTNDGVICLTSEAYSYVTVNYDPATEIADVNIYGGAFSGDLDISVLGMNISTKDGVFPISYHFNVTLNKAQGQAGDAEYSMNQFMKLLPGSTFTVGKGVKLTLGTFSIYDEFIEEATRLIDGAPQSTHKYPTDKAPAKFLVYGTVIADYLGGDVYTDGDGASVTVRVSTTVDTHEVLEYVDSSWSSRLVSAKTITKELNLYFGDKLCVSRVVIGAEYVSSAQDQTWSFDISKLDTVEYQLGNGYGVYTEFAVLTDENGNLYVGPYDSRTTKTNGALIVTKGTKITFYLDKNSLLVTDGSTSVSVDASHPLLGTEASYEVTVTAGDAVSPVVYYVPSFTLTCDVKGYTVTYYELNTANKAGSSTAYALISLTKTSKRSGYDITVKVKVTGIDAGNITVSAGSLSAGEYTATGSGSATVTIAIRIDEANAGAAVNVTSSVDEVKQSGGGSTGCITPDTLITLADGTLVRVDELTGEEMLLVWNLESGRFDSAPILFIDTESEIECEVVYLYFSDGTVVKVVYEHGFWDYGLNEYVYLDENAADYIGHTFAKQVGDGLEAVELIRVEIKIETVRAYSPVTEGHLCYFVDGMLSMPGGIAGLFNIFEVDADTMSYDLEAMERDIATYGLYTYEELNAICTLPEEMFNAAGGAYLKVAIGKGNLTVDALEAMIERYSVYFA